MSEDKDTPDGQPVTTPRGLERKFDVAFMTGEAGYRAAIEIREDAPLVRLAAIVEARITHAHSAADVMACADFDVHSPRDIADIIEPMLNDARLLASALHKRLAAEVQQSEGATARKAAKKLAKAKRKAQEVSNG